MGHRLGQNVGGGVVKGPLAVLVGEGKDLQGAVVVQDGAQVHHFAVHPGGAGGPVEPHAQVLGGLGGGDGILVLLNRAILQGQFHKLGSSYLYFFQGKRKSSALPVLLPG